MRIKTSISAAASAIVIGLFSASAMATEETEFPPYPPSTVTSAEIAADLQAWSRAALPEVTRQEESPEVFSADYRERYANYLRLHDDASAKKAAR